MFIRFGELPYGGKSVNFLKMSFKQQDDFIWDIKFGEYQRAYDVADKIGALEKGTSAFEVGADGLPVIKDYMQMLDLTSRLDRSDKALYITGDVVGLGHGGEPLIENSQVIDAEPDIDAVRRFVRDWMFDRYECIEGSKETFNLERVKICKFVDENGTVTFSCGGCEFVYDGK